MRTQRRYVPAVRYSDEQLARFVLADKLNDARSSLKYARELANGANPAHYGMTREQYMADAARLRAEVRAARQ